MARGSKSNAARKVETPVVSAPSFPTTDSLVASGFNTKSARIRELARLGMSKGDIARQETNGLYQHVYNVLKRPLKKPAVAAPQASETAGDETDSNA